MQERNQVTTLGFPILQSVPFSSDIHKFIHPAHSDLNHIFEVVALGVVTGSQGLLGQVSNEQWPLTSFQQLGQNRSEGVLTFVLSLRGF
jgi:hypothetical protein